MFDTKIELFIDTVEQGSFSAAAKKNYISQSAVSQAISKLEAELGIVLFNRFSYRPTLTNAGKYYYDAVKQYYEEYTKVVKNAKKLSMKENKISIGVSNRFERKHLPDIVNEFKKKYPVNIEIKRVDPTDAIHQLNNHKLHLCFGMKEDFEEEKNLSCFDVHESTVCIICSKDNPLSKYKEIHVDQIKEEPTVLLNHMISEKTFKSFMKSFELDGFVPDIVKECDNMDDFIMSVELNEGIGYTITELVEKEDDILSIPLIGSHHKSILALGYHKDENNEIVLNLIKEIVDNFKRL